ncbi:MAG: aromatic ring-hydroxylating dioxygenase subunit alpha [Pseudomonadota bacterium]|nr:aromatic ring-hydroxylating dioxygenase subunit alpha [Pseudomonadota bacterium]
MSDKIADFPISPVVRKFAAASRDTAGSPRGSNSLIADRDTPLIQNCWYILDWSLEVEHSLKNRMILGHDLVYFRTRSGDVTALQNRCAHRCFPLHRSKLHDDDTIQCNYHGLTYDAKGRCVKIPSAPSQNSATIRIKHYPVVERPPFLWIWPGDVEKAAPDHVPDCDWVNDKSWGYGDGYYHLKGNYLAIHENLLDITHFQFLHGAVLGTPHFAEAKIDVTEDGNTVDNYRINLGEPLPGLHGDSTGLGDTVVNRHAHSAFVTPGFHEAITLMQDPAGTLGGRTEYHAHILHLITPETQFTTHYWWVFARDFNPNVKKWDKFYSDSTRRVFTEDADAIEWIEKQWANEERPDFREANVPADKGAVAMRRIVQRMADAEQAAV